MRRKGRDAEALTEFQEAVRLNPSGRAKAQVGLAQMAIGLFEAAEATLSEVLSPSTRDPWVDGRRAALTDALTKTQSHLGTLTVRGSPEGATVEVNGTKAGLLPCSIRVQGGDVVVRVLAPGFIPIRRTVPVETGQSSVQVFTLVKVAADGVPGPVSTENVPPRAPSNDERSEPQPISLSAPEKSGSQESGHSSAWPWIAAGGSLVALSVGTVAGLRWRSKASEFNNMTDAQGMAICGTDKPENGGSSCDRVLSEGRTAAAIAIGGLVVGAALGVTSAVLFLREPPADSGQALACAPALGSAGLVCSGRF